MLRNPLKLSIAHQQMSTFHRQHALEKQRTSGLDQYDTHCGFDTTTLLHIVCMHACAGAELLVDCKSLVPNLNLVYKYTNLLDKLAAKLSSKT